MFTEAKLIKYCLKGHKKKQQILYERYSSKMYFVCLRYSKNRLDAEDILQEAFVNVFKYLKDFRQDCPLEHWIKRIVVSSAIRYKKKFTVYDNMQDIELISDYSTEENLTLSDYNYRELLKMVQKLPEGCQVIFNLYAIEGYKHKEIADMLDITVGTSKSQYSRAKLLLQELIENEKRVVADG